MSLTGKPPQDFCLSNLAVQNTVVTPTLTTLNLETESLNDVSTDQRSYRILSVFTGAQMGTVFVHDGYSQIDFGGLLNQSGNNIPANTVIAYVENAVTDAPILLPMTVYCPFAPTIADAVFPGTSIIHEDGTITFDTALTSADVTTYRCPCGPSRARVMNNAR